ncbi:flagellar cap protein [Methylophaga sp. 42_8_T64]|nr:flagellar cap protein [Methylophaga sp. 41_12_T18]OUR86294.1 flagellar cap protein [Methylophaga sp. 42_8_T64]
MAITASGIGSGIDIESLVTQLVAAEADPVNSRLNLKETGLDAELSAYGTLKSALTAFQTSVTKLESAEDSFQVYTASSSDETVFTAAAGSSAVAGDYSIEVVQLAQAAKLRSGDFTDSSEVIGTGTLDISLGADSFQLTIDGTNNTLAGIRDAINAASDNPGITASLINVDSGTQLVLSSNQVGAANTVTVAAVDDDALDGFDLTRLDSVNLATQQGALDAIINVDSQLVTRSSNSFSDVIAGVTFNLANTNIGETEILSVVTDITTVKENIESFVTNYNTLVGVMKGLSNYDESTGVSGALNGDSVVRGIQGQLREALFAGVSGGTFSTLSELGITLDDTGSLEVEDTVLDEALSSNLSAVASFFSSTNGLAQSFTTALSGYVDSDGIIENRQDSIQNRLDDIDDDRDTLTRRMASLEARLSAQFIAMDILVAQLQSTGDFLTSQLANLPSPNSIGN